MCAPREVSIVSVTAQKLVRSVRSRHIGLSIAMHVRHGDSCDVFANASTFCPCGCGYSHDTSLYVRTCYPLFLYMVAANRMKQKYGASHIFLMTDDESIIKETSRYENFTFTFISVDRQNLFGSSEAGLHSAADYIELKEYGENRRTMQEASLIADLTLVRQADMFIGTRCTALAPIVTQLIESRTARRPPYIFSGLISPGVTDTMLTSLGAHMP